MPGTRMKACLAGLVGCSVLLLIYYYNYDAGPDSVRPVSTPRTRSGLQRFLAEEPLDAKVILLGILY